LSAFPSVPAGVRTVGTDTADSTRLVLVRHGEAKCNVDGVVGGPRGCRGLSPVGARQADALALRLAATGELAGASALYASVLQRALDTADAIARWVGGGMTPVADCALCELHPGDADGLTWAEFSERYGEPDWDADPGTPLAPGGESWSSFVQRAHRALVELAARHQGSTVVVVCHAGVVESAMLRFLPLASGEARLGLRTAHTSITEFETTDGGWRLLRYNDAAHLQGSVDQPQQA